MDCSKGIIATIKDVSAMAWFLRKMTAERDQAWAVCPQAS
jgi:hypothetical protein